jgi:hypothetical protein
MPKSFELRTVGWVEERNPASKARMPVFRKTSTQPVGCADEGSTSLANDGLRASAHPTAKYPIQGIIHSLLP